MNKAIITSIVYLILIMGISGFTLINQNAVIKKLDGYKYNDDIQGQYFNRNYIILYMNNQYPMDIQVTAMHEICHYIWYNYLSYLDQAEYNRIVSNSTQYVSEYSKTNIMEDFAEHCAYWSLGARIDKEREEFLDQEVRRYIWKPR